MVKILEPKTESMAKTYKILQKLNIKSSLKGYDYLLYAIATLYEAENTQFKGKIRPVIYNIIAQKFNTTISRIDRNLRTIISSIYTSAPKDLLRDIIGETAKIIPTQFISSVAMYMRYCCQ